MNCLPAVYLRGLLWLAIEMTNNDVVVCAREGAAWMAQQGECRVDRMQHSLPSIPSACPRRSVFPQTPQPTSAAKNDGAGVLSTRGRRSSQRRRQGKSHGGSCLWLVGWAGLVRTKLCYVRVVAVVAQGGNLRRKQDRSNNSLDRPNKVSSEEVTVKKTRASHHCQTAISQNATRPVVSY